MKEEVVNENWIIFPFASWWALRCSAWRDEAIGVEIRHCASQKLTALTVESIVL